MYNTPKERKEANLKRLQERTQKIAIRRRIKKIVKEQVGQQRDSFDYGAAWNAFGDAAAAGGSPYLSAYAAGSGRTIQQIESASDVLAGVLDVLGIAPVVGEVFDIASFGISILRNDFLSAVTSLISLIPTAGDAVAKPVKFVIRLGRAEQIPIAIVNLITRLESLIPNPSFLATTLNIGKDLLSTAINLLRRYRFVNSLVELKNLVTEGFFSRETADLATQQISSLTRGIVDIILQNQRLKATFAGSNGGQIVDNLITAARQIENALTIIYSTFEQAINRYSTVREVFNPKNISSLQEKTQGKFMHKTLKERKEANLKRLQERTQKIILRREIKKVVKEQIIFERKQQQLNEGLGDILGTIAHLSAGVWGSFIPAELTGTAEAADIANGVVYILEGDFLMALLSFISAYPVLGDIVGKPIMALNGLSRMLSNEGRIASSATQIAGFLTRNSSTIQNSAEQAYNFVRRNKDRIKHAIKDARVEAARVTSSGDNEESNSNSTDSNQRQSRATGTDDSFTGKMVEILLKDDRVREKLADINVVNGLTSAVDELENIYKRIVDSFTPFSAANEEEITDAVSEFTGNEELSSVSTERPLNESKAGRVSLKVLF